MEFRKLLLFFLVASPLQVFGFGPKYFYARHFTLGPNCEFKGYAPGGNKIMVQKIEAPVATMQKGLFAGLAGNMKKGAAGAQHSAMLLKGFGKLANIAPKLGPALGLFGVAFSIVKSFTDPSPQDILDQANKAIAELTEEVNNRLNEMKGYVEEKVIKLEKDLIEREYQSLFRIWSNCLKETTKEKVDECQEDAAKDIMGARPKFAIFWDRVQSNEMLPVYDVKRLEANLLTFRDYVILCFASLSALTASLENEPGKKLDYQRYANDLNYEIDWSVKYVKNAFDIIQRMHIGGNNCKDTFKCTKLEEAWEGWPGAHTQDFRLCSCVFDRADVSTMKCEEKIMIRVDGKTKLPTYQWYYTGKTDRQSGIAEIGKMWLHEHKRHYMKALDQSLTNYWQGEVLDLLSSWESLKVNVTSDQKDEMLGSNAYHLSIRSRDYMRRREFVEYEMAVQMDMQYSNDGYHNDRLAYRRDSRHGYEPHSEFYNNY